MKNLTLSNGLTVSQVALGAITFGTTTSKQESFYTLDAFLSNGGNFIDTSNNYAHWLGTGDESETTIGEYFKERGNRDKFIIATKVGFDRHGKGQGLKKEQIEYWIDQSLKKLNTDYIDLYYAHTDDENTPLEETMEAFDILIKKGKVRFLGGSNYDTWRFSEANNIALQNNFTPFSVMQQKYSYLHYRHEIKPDYIFNEPVNRERLRYLSSKNIPLVAYSCLCNGGYENLDKLPKDVISDKRYELVKELAKQKGVSNNAIIIAYLTNLYRCKGFPTVIPLFSANTKHLQQNLKGLEITLTDKELELMNNT